MRTDTIIALAVLALYVFSMAHFASAILVDADYVTLYAGEEKSIKINVENNENFDMKDVSVALVLSMVNPTTGAITSLPFSVVGSLEEDLDDLDEDDDDSASFTLRAATDITPGDYNIPYIVKYTNKDTDDEDDKEGTFSLRVSAKTDIDFATEVKDNVIGKQGRVSLEIINKGLGELKAVSVEVTPQGYELLSKNKVFIGTISAEDSDLATFDVLFNSQSAKLSAKVTYKDFDNNEQTETVNLPVQVYTQEQALQLGLIKKSNAFIYILIVAILIIAYIIYRIIKRRIKKRKREELRK